MEIIKIINKGMLSTIQDLGRVGYKQYGVPQSGAMDSYALRVANILVDNDENTPVIEVTYGAFKCSFLHDAIISVTGGNIGGFLNNKFIAMWQTLKVEKGDVLEFRGGEHFRGYLAINKGIECERILGSYSTYERAGFNKPIEDNQIIKGELSNLDGAKIASISEIPKYDNIIRFVKGPHNSFFSDEHLDELCFSEYTVTSASDRMGVRLEGKKIKTSSKDLLSCPLPIGAIQVPPSGQPIVIMADGQVTGGYPIIGCVISTDISKLAQQKPGNNLMFKEVSVEEAHNIKREQEELVDKLKARDFREYRQRNFNVKVKGKEYFVQVYE